MCGRYALLAKQRLLEKRFGAKVADPEAYTPQANIGPGKQGLVITSREPDLIQHFTFGLTPFWASKPMYLFNARSEGDFNRQDDPAYKGEMGIYVKPAFRKPIRSQRCIVPADCFYEGSKKAKLSKPYVIYHLHEQPFAFAGVWDEWINQDTGEVVSSFSLITTVANSITKTIGHHRSPVILTRDTESIWLDPKASVSDVQALLKPISGDVLNAYPVSSAMKSPRAEGESLLKPTGDYLKQEGKFLLLDELGVSDQDITPMGQQSLF